MSCTKTTIYFYEACAIPDVLKRFQKIRITIDLMGLLKFSKIPLEDNEASEVNIFILICYISTLRLVFKVSPLSHTL